MKFTRRGLIYCLAGSAPLAAQSPFLDVKEPKDDELRFEDKIGAFQVTDIDGREWNREALLGRVTVVYHWAVWCLSCIDKNPILQDLHAKHEDSEDLQVLTFCTGQGDTSRTVRAFMNHHGYTYPVVIDPGAKVAEPLIGHGPYGIPECRIIDRQGRKSAAFRAWPFGKVLLEAERLSRKK